MKHVILIGANGHTSQEIIPRLLGQEDVTLTLFLRRAKRLQSRKSGRVDVVEGDAKNLDDLRQAIKGQNIVVSTLGGMDLDIKTANIVQAMEDAGVRRLVAISAGGIYDELPEPFNAWDKQMVGQTRPINLKAAEAIERSSLDYTILRPVWLTDDASEEFELMRKGDSYKGTETSRASIGRCVADVVENPRFVCLREPGNQPHRHRRTRQRTGQHQSGRPGNHPAQHEHPADADQPAGPAGTDHRQPGSCAASVPAAVLQPGSLAMSTTKKLRLGPLPKTESVKMTFACPASLKADLERYAALHAQAYGEAVDAEKLIPHMLEAFMAGDRGFKKGTTTRSTPSKLT